MRSLPAAHAHCPAIDSTIDTSVVDGSASVWATVPASYIGIVCSTAVPSTVLAENVCATSQALAEAMTRSASMSEARRLPPCTYCAQSSAITAGFEVKSVSPVRRSAQRAPRTTALMLGTPCGNASWL